MPTALVALLAQGLAVWIGAAALAASAHAGSPQSIVLSTEVEFAELELPPNLRAAEQGLEDSIDYVRAYERSGDETRIGLILPAPTVVAWDLIIPPDSELQFAPVLIRRSSGSPEQSSLGFVLEVEIEVPEGTSKLYSKQIRNTLFEGVRLDLSKWAGRRVRLRMRTSADRRVPGELHFIAQPVITRLGANTRRVVLIFIDTLRPDHLGSYGYPRDTSPNIDSFAKGAVLFEAARSVAPWTLPSARSALTGHLPDRYSQVVPLPERLRRRGFATAMFAANWYLDQHFEMQRGWELLRSVIGESAERQTQHALAWLREQRGRDALLLVHYMDPHLPYREPSSHRELFAQADVPAPLADFELRQDVFALHQRLPVRAREYLIGRYDNNIRYVDDALAPLLAALGADDVIVLFSDHGEEFFEHGSFEHGHTLYDELLRVPLVIRAPGLEPSRVRSPVSLMDIAPTVLDLLGLPHADMRGVSLVAAASAGGDARAALETRSLAFGWPLYGSERWGFFRGNEKWMTSAGRLEHYDLKTDPDESRDLASAEGNASPESVRGPLSAALGHPVESVLRLHVGRAPRTPSEDLMVTLRVPGGIARSWWGSDPVNQSRVRVDIDGDVLRATFAAGFQGEREIFIVPNETTSTSAGRVSGYARLGAGIDAPLVRSSPALNGMHRMAAARTPDGRSVHFGLAVAPDPGSGSLSLSGDHPALRAQLRALGYEVGPDATQPGAGGELASGAP